MRLFGAEGVSVERVARSFRVALSRQRLVDAFVAAGGAFVTILLLAYVGKATSIVLLIAPFGASCVLVFALPQSPLAQPRNVIGGHLIASTAGLVAQAMAGATPFGFAIGVSLAVACMIVTATVHPPAGADPIVVLLSGATPRFLAVPVLIGAVFIVLVGCAYHRVASGKSYPLR